MAKKHQTKYSKIFDEITELRQKRFKKLKLENGTVLETDGKVIFILSDGDRIPLPVGNYTLDNGMTLIVKIEGMVDNIIKTKKTAKQINVEKAMDKLKIQKKQKFYKFNLI
jgi:hypothetical protein